MDKKTMISKYKQMFVTARAMSVNNKRSFMHDLISLNKHEHNHSTYYAISMFLNAMGTFKEINWFQGIDESEAVHLARSIVFYKEGENVIVPDNYFVEAYSYILKHLPGFQSELLFSKVSELCKLGKHAEDKVEQVLYQLEKAISLKKLDINKSSALGVLLSNPEIAIAVMKIRKDICKLLKSTEYDLTHWFLEINMQNIDLTQVLGNEVSYNEILHILSADHSMIVNYSPRELLALLQRLQEPKRIDTFSKIIKLATHREYHFS